MGCGRLVACAVGWWRRGEEGRGQLVAVRVLECSFWRWEWLVGERCFLGRLFSEGVVAPGPLQ